MTKQVHVTGAQRDAARMIVQRSTAQGRSVSPSVRKIADASTRSVGVVATATKTQVERPQLPSFPDSGAYRSPEEKVPAAGTDRRHHSASDLFKMIKASLRRRPAR